MAKAGAFFAMLALKRLRKIDWEELALPRCWASTACASSAQRPARDPQRDPNWSVRGAAVRTSIREEIASG
jgi:hypothetical protein